MKYMKLFAALAVAVIGTVVMRFSPLSATNLSIKLNSSVDGETMLFYRKINGSYSGEWRSSEHLARGPNQVSLPFDWFSDPLRWDPPDGPGSFRVEAIGIRIAWMDFPLVVEQLHGERDIQAISAQGPVIQLQTTADAIDPQITIPSIGFDPGSARTWVSVASGIGMGLASFALLVVFDRKQRLLGGLDQFVRYLSRSVGPGTGCLKDFAILSAIALTIHSFSLIHFNISVDDEYGAMRTSPDIWIGQGRWAVYLIERFVFNHPVMPFLPNALLCFAMAISYIYLCRLHRIYDHWKKYALFILFCGFPTWWFIEEFYSNLAAASLGLLCATMASFALAQSTDRRKPDQPKGGFGIMLIAGSFLAIAIACYQSLLFYFLAIAIAHPLFRIHHKDAFCPGDIARYVLRMSGGTIIGIIAYLLINRLMQSQISSSTSYMEGLWRIDELRNAPLHILHSAIGQAYDMYRGAASCYGINLQGLYIVVLCPFALFLLSGDRQPGERIASIILGLGLLSTPFALNLVTGGNVEVRTLISFPYVIWCMAAILCSGTRPSVSAVAGFITAWNILFCMYANAQYSASTWLATRHDYTLASDIYRRMGEANPSYDRSKPAFIDIYGTKSVDVPYPSPPGSTMRASFFDWDNGNEGRMVVFMRMMGFKELEIAPDAIRKEATEKHFKSMPTWPASGCVIFNNGIYYIKIGATMDSFHGKYPQ